MPKICYKEKRFQKLARSIIEISNVILNEYAEQGFDLTLRQLYYQFVARDLIENTQQSYNLIGRVTNDARLAGFIDWDHIVDRTRNVRIRSHWKDPDDVLDTAYNMYHIDMWEDQEFYVEVWIEKDALVGVIEGVCRKYDVPYFSCRGYVSQSEMWKASLRLIEKNQTGCKVIILQLSDHDPSGIDMTRDIRDRLKTFLVGEYGVYDVRRIALNIEQTKKYKLPPNFAKIKDPRSKEYISEFGQDSWELDALEPKVIVDLIDNHISEYIDFDIWDEREKQKNKDKKHLKGLISK